MTTPDPSGPPAKTALLARLSQPRFLLIVWLWAGGLFLAFLLVSSMLPKGKPGAPSPGHLLRGEMADLELAFPPRMATQVGFIGGFSGEKSSVFLSDFKGKVVVVNLWASWCTPCLTELPSLAKLQAVFPQNLVVVPVAVENKPTEALQQLLDRIDAGALPIYRDPAFTFAMTFGGETDLPLTIIYDATGREIGRMTGATDWASTESLNLIRAIIAGQKID